MDFVGPWARPRPADPIIPNAGGFAHAPKDESYDEAFFAPQSFSFSCSLDERTNHWRLREAMCNPDLKPTWTVNDVTWETTKGRGSIVMANGQYVPTRPFFDTRKVAAQIQVLWSDSRAGSNIGMLYDEIYIPPSEVTIEEGPDDVTLSITGLIYGNVEPIGAFTAGNDCGD